MARILHKRSSTTGVTPSATEIDLGEMAVNTADGKVFIKKTNGTVVQVGGGTVTSVTAGTGLSGGTITASGTISANFGTAAGTICQGNDSRLSNARTPTAHTHTTTEITDFQITSVADKNLLQYSTSAAKWVNVAQDTLVDGGNF